MRIWTEEQDEEHIYVDVGEDDTVLEFMHKNTLWVNKFYGNVATISRTRFSLIETARIICTMVDFYLENDWEVTDEAKSIADDLRTRAEEERIKMEERNIKKWFEEHEKAKKRAKEWAPFFRVRRG